MGVPTIQPAKSVEYQTPRDLFDELWEEHGGFDLDPCCRPEHYTAQRVLTWGAGRICVPHGTEVAPAIQGPQVRADGLAQQWVNAASQPAKVYLNPPYGNALKLWVPKAVHEVECGNAELVVALLPSKTDVKWWAEYVLTGVHRHSNDNEPGSLQPGAFWGHYLLHQVRFIKGRLKFAGEEGPARHGSVIVVWRK